jgi:hypothetical protein
MRLLILISLFLPAIMFAQKKEIKTRDVKNLTINGNNTTVNIAKVEITEQYKPATVFDTAISFIDTTGEFVTQIRLKTRSGEPFFNVSLQLIFSDSVLNVKRDFIGGGTAMMQSYGLGEDFKSYGYDASQINARYLLFTVKSKKKVFTTIYGVSEK